MNQNPILTGLISAVSYLTFFYFLPRSVKGWKRQIISFALGLGLYLFIFLIIDRIVVE